MFEQICEVIADTLKCDIAEISMETNLSEDLGADSLDAVEINMALEEAFDVKISDEELVNLKTVADLLAFIEVSK